MWVAASVRPGSGRVHEHTTLGSRPALGTPSAKRSVGTRRAASMQDTLPEGTARAAQLAPSAVSASAVGGSANRSVVADSLRRRAVPLRRAIARAPPGGKPQAVDLTVIHATLLRQGQTSEKNTAFTLQTRTRKPKSAKVPRACGAPVSLLLGACGAESQLSDSESKSPSNSHIFPAAAPEETCVRRT